jgi:alpha-glucoside transport system permease protein
LILPLAVPALASFAIFQFLWVWNDYLVALIFIGASPTNQLVTQRLAEIVGSRGQDWHLLTAGVHHHAMPLGCSSRQRFFVPACWLVRLKVKDSATNSQNQHEFRLLLAKFVLL